MEILVANRSHVPFAQLICETIESSAKVRGTGIARRRPEYIIEKMDSNKAIIALEGDTFAGFCYIEDWDHGKYVAHSGLVVAPDFRKSGLAKKIKRKAFEHSRKMYPNAKIFGITTGLAVMKINYELGYKPVTFSELTKDPEFWQGCKTCKNYDVLTRNNRSMCLCTGMLFDPKAKKTKTSDKKPFRTKVFARLKKIKEALFLKPKKELDKS